MALLGRIGILIGDYQPFEGGVVRWGMNDSLAILLRTFMEMDQKENRDLLRETVAYRHRLLEYFDDPTAYFLKWARMQK
jgi:hypothetical protein